MEGNNCSKFSTELNHTLALRITNGTTSSISLLCCIFVIALMIIYKKYVFTIQRLILYLTVSILLNSMSHIFESASYTLAQADSYCMALGFLQEYSAYCMLLFVSCFLLEIGVRVICLRETGAIEWLYIPAIFVTPLLVTWIPFLTGNYGRMGLSCRIVTINSTTCEQDIKGLILYFVLWGIPMYLTFIVDGLAYVYILWKLWRSKKRYTAVLELDRELMYQKTVSEIHYLKWYPPIYILINLIPVAAYTVYYVKPDGPGLALIIIAMIIRRMQGAFLLIAVTMDPKTRKRLKWSHIKAAFIENVLCKYSNIEEYPIISAPNYTDSLNPN